MSNSSYYGIKTITLQKIKEFFSEFQYTIIAPLISSFIFVIILSTISSYYSIIVEEDNYLDFVVPGVVMMIVMLIHSKYGCETIIEDYVVSKKIKTFTIFIFYQ